MTTRIITALIVGAFWLLLLFVAPFTLFWGTFILAGTIMGWEFSNTVLKEEKTSIKVLTTLLLLLPYAFSYSGHLEFLSASLFTGIFLLIVMVIFRYEQLKDPFSIILKGIIGIVLVGFFPAHIVLIQQMPNGPLLLLFLTAITIASDSCAFFTGTFLGKRKLCPSVSPNKTVEGLLGGLIGSGIAGILVATLFLGQNNSITIIIYSCLLGCIGMVGDLTESMLKRWSGVKDSGNIMPGHGGLMDRLDSLMLAAPAFYYLQQWHLIFPSFV